MTHRLPIKNLIRLNWLLLAAFTAIVSLYLFFLLDELPLHKLFYTGMTALGIGLVGFSNVGILFVLEQRLNIKEKAFKRYRYLCTYSASAIVYLLLSPIFDHIGNHSKLYPYGVYTAIFVVSSVVVNTIIILLQNFIILQSDKSDSDLENSRLKTAHAEGTILLLKQQIHPHFLFNALNTLKALYRKDHSMADTYIVHLANFLRASVFDHDAKVAKVFDELTLLNDYLEMQKIRFGSALNCVIDVPESIQKEYYLPCFSLQPLLENAIKHNELTIQTPLNVCIIYQENRIVVSNNLQKKKIKASSANHGLANLAERYRLLSGDEILITESNKIFSISIKLLPNEYSYH
jgi:two-component system LytT family sensor kinase